jgi:hypothetical protein
VRDTQIQKTLRSLIRDIKGMELESGRMLAYEELRTFHIDPQLINFILRQVAEARSTDELVARLDSFAVHQGQGRLGPLWLVRPIPLRTVPPYGQTL